MDAGPFATDAGLSVVDAGLSLDVCTLQRSALLVDVRLVCSARACIWPGTEVFDCCIWAAEAEVDPRRALVLKQETCKGQHSNCRMVVTLRTAPGSLLARLSKGDR